MIEPTRNMEVLRRWIGRNETVIDRVDARQARLMQTTLDKHASLTEGDELPPFWHYLYFNPEIPTSDLGPDGHEKLGRFLPPVDLPRRMWAGGRVEIARPFRLGERVRKTSVIRDVAIKTGRSGALCFVTVDHSFHASEELCFTETQNIVYREMPTSSTPHIAGKPAPELSVWQRRITPDPVMLFRYSALIFYGHRIHYDAPYVQDVEGYPGLVVHGPLTASLLVGYGCDNQPGARLKAFDIRAHSPLFAPDAFQIEGKPTDQGALMWVRKSNGDMAMSVNLEFG